MNNLLDKIRHDLHGLQADDQATLVQIGAALQQFVSELPAGAPAVTDLLMSCLHALQAIYQQTYTDFAQLKAAIHSRCSGKVCELLAYSLNHEELSSKTQSV